jgi:hypothetical protein
LRVCVCVCVCVHITHKFTRSCSNQHFNSSFRGQMKAHHDEIMVLFPVIALNSCEQGSLQNMAKTVSRAASGSQEAWVFLSMMPGSTVLSTSSLLSLRFCGTVARARGSCPDCLFLDFPSTWENPLCVLILPQVPISTEI